MLSKSALSTIRIQPPQTMNAEKAITSSRLFVVRLPSGIVFSYGVGNAELHRWSARRSGAGLQA